MADEEVSPTEFRLNIDVNFEAKDIVTGLEKVEVLDLIQELDSELDSWEATLLLARYFALAAAQAPDALLRATDEELEAALLAETEQP